MVYRPPNENDRPPGASLRHANTVAGLGGKQKGPGSLRRGACQSFLASFEPASGRRRQHARRRNCLHSCAHARHSDDSQDVSTTHSSGHAVRPPCALASRSCVPPRSRPRPRYLGRGLTPSASCASLTSLTTSASSHYSQSQSPLHTRSFVVKKPLSPTPTSAPPLAVPSSPSSTSLVSVFRTASLNRFRRSKSKAKERPKKEPATPEDTVRVDYPYIGAHLDRERSAVPPPPEHAYTHGLPDPHLPLPPHNVRWQVAHSPSDVRTRPHRSPTDPDADSTPVTPPSEFSARFQAWGKARAHRAPATPEPLSPRREMPRSPLATLALEEEDRASREISPAPDADAPRSSTCSYSESDEQQTLRGRRAPPCALLPRPPSDMPTSFLDLDVDEEACASTLTPPPTPGRLDELVPSKDNVLVFTLDVGEEADARMVRLDGDDDVDVDRDGFGLEDGLEILERARLECVTPRMGSRRC